MSFFFFFFCEGTGKRGEEGEREAGGGLRRGEAGGHLGVIFLTVPFIVESNPHCLLIPFLGLAAAGEWKSYSPFLLQNNL